MDFEVERMDPLFATEEDYEEFNKRQSSYKVATGDLASYKGNCYLGIDAGSTTTKTALVGEDGSLLYSFYSNNNGSPLKTAIRSIQEIYSKLPKDARIAYACSTGYGEALSQRQHFFWTREKLRRFLIIMQQHSLIRKLTVFWILVVRI